MKNLEIEYKVMISKEDFIKLNNLLAKNNFKYYEQTNYYYDTINDDLKTNNYSLRIRHIENLSKYIITLKIAELIGKMEYEYEIDSLSLDKVPPKIIEKLSKINVVVNNLELKGSLKTIRKEIVIDNSIVCLDFNTYNNNEDYEIECESSSMEKAKQIINTLVNKYGISYIPSKYSKVARALKKH